MEILFRGKKSYGGEWVYGLYWASLDPFSEEKKWRGHYIHNGCNICEPTEIIKETVGQLRYKKGDTRYFDGDIYIHAGYGEEIVSDLCQLQCALLDGNEDDIGEIIGNIHNKE